MLRARNIASRFNFSKALLTLVVMMLIAEAVYAQDDEQRITALCQASLRQMVFWCVAAGPSAEAITTLREQQNKCKKAKALVDGRCYPVQIPQLACNTSLQEMEIWCAGTAKLNVLELTGHCEQSQRNIRFFCYR